MWPTEYTIHEHRKDLERTAAQIRLARAAATQQTRWTARVVNVMHMFRLRRRRPQPAVQPVVRPALRRMS